MVNDETFHQVGSGTQVIGVECKSGKFQKHGTDFN
jgi:hypothetical protein